MKVWRLFVFGLAAYVLCLIATAPATLLDAPLQQASGGRLRLAEARGTLWSGTGQIQLRDKRGRSGVAKNISWHFRPGYLLQGQLRYELGIDQDARHFDVELSPSRIEIRNVDVALPAAALGVGVANLAPLGLTGEVLLHAERLAFVAGTIQGNATLHWRGAGSAFTRVSPLGDYELRLAGEGSAARLTLRTLQGPLQLEGKGTWTRGGGSAFGGSARIAPPHVQQLAPLLRMIAVERGEGQFDLQLVF